MAIRTRNVYKPNDENYTILTNMKLWKWIVGLFAAIGGAAAIGSTQKKKAHEKNVKENKDSISKVDTKAEVNSKEIELLKLQIKEIQIKSNNPLGG